MAGHRIFKTSVASVYPHYVSKVEKKGRTKEEVDEILCWLTGYGASELGAQLERGTDLPLRSGCEALEASCRRLHGRLNSIRRTASGRSSTDRAVHAAGSRTGQGDPQDTFDMTNKW